MTPQQIFDTVAKHLLTQNARATRERGPEDDSGDTQACVYRTDTGLTCAVGCLIPEALYNPDMDNASKVQGTAISANQIVQRVLDNLGVIDFHAGAEDNRLKLLRNLQRTHDSYDVEDWPEELRDLARRFELSAEVLG